MTADKTPVICFYHGDCMDGFTSAWIVKHLHPNAELIPVNYQDDLPALPMDSIVYVVDFTFPDDDFMAMLVDNNQRVLHFEHHITAQETVDYLQGRFSKEQYLGVFDKERSGAGITWDVLNPGQDRPHLVNFVEDRDLWLFKYSETKLFGEGLSTLDKTIDAWNWAHRKENCQWLLEKGAEVKERRIERCIQQIETTGKELDIEFEGETYPAFLSFLADPMDSSEQTHMVVMATDYKIALGVHVLDDGRWKVRVTTAQDGPNAAEIAKRFSDEGGGHQHAAGFIIGANVL